MQIYLTWWSSGMLSVQIYNYSHVSSCMKRYKVKVRRSVSFHTFVSSSPISIYCKPTGSYSLTKKWNEMQSLSIQMKFSWTQTVHFELPELNSWRKHNKARYNLYNEMHDQYSGILFWYGYRFFFPPFISIQFGHLQISSFSYRSSPMTSF